jgi:putative DNA primase/helicase
MTQNLAEALAVIEAQKKIICSQREKLQWYEGLHKNKDLQGGAMRATIAAKLLAETSQPGEDGYYKVYLPKLADMVGVSPSTMSRGLRTLADCTDALEHRTEAKKGEPYKDVVYIRPTDLLDHPDLIKPTKEIKRHGGSRKCECGGELLVKERVLTSQQYTVCTACGEQHIFPARIVNEALEVSEPLHHATALSEMEESAIFADLPAEEISDPEPLHDAIYTYRHSDAPGIAFDSIPAELRCKMQWSCHRAKVPFDAKILNPARMKSAAASSTNEATWASYEQAVKTWQASQKWALPYDGIGFMLNSDFVLADFDHCITEGQVTHLAVARIKALDTYSELSYSGTGIHCIARASIPNAVKRPDCELYHHSRFVVMTGKSLVGTPSEIQDCQAQIAALHTEISPPKATRQATHCVFTSCSLSDTEVIEKALGARNSAKFRALMNGDITGYPSHSEADLAYCVLLAYWTGKDTTMMHRLFKQSSLFREKWDRSVGSGETYGERTVRLALCGQEQRIAS